MKSEDMNKKSGTKQEAEGNTQSLQGIWTTDRMNLGMRLHDTPQMGLEERLSYIEKQGFTCAHVALSKVLGANESADMALTPGYANILRRMFAEHRIDFAVLGCYLNLANPDRRQLNWPEPLYGSYQACSACRLRSGRDGDGSAEYGVSVCAGMSYRRGVSQFFVWIKTRRQVCGDTVE